MSIGLGVPFPSTLKLGQVGECNIFSKALQKIGLCNTSVEICIENIFGGQNSLGLTYRGGENTYSVSAVDTR